MTACALVKEAQKGSEEALESLLDQYGYLVRRLVRRFFLPGQEREDVVQEGLIGLLQGIRCYDSSLDPCLENHLSRCARNQIVAALRKAGRRRQRVLTDASSLDEGERDSAQIASVAPNPERVVLMRMALQEALRDGVRNLSGHERRILWATALGFSHREITESTGLSSKQVENSLYRARTKIRRSPSAWVPDTLCG